MKSVSGTVWILIAAVAVIFALGSEALAQEPSSAPHVGQVPDSAQRAYDRLKSYFSNEAASHFTIVSTDAHRYSIVARRDDIDSRTWADWAYCKMGASHMLDTFDHGTATVTVQVDPDGKHASDVSIDADLEGSYRGLGQQGQSTLRCVSQGALEKTILAEAGASPNTK